MRRLVLLAMFLFSFTLLASVLQAQWISPPTTTKAPVTADEYFNRGSDRVERGNRKGAIEDFTKAIELNPRLAVAYTNRGYQHLAAAAYDLAIADFTKALELDPEDAIARLKRGDALYEKGDLDAALVDTNAYIRVDEKSVLGYIARADIMSLKGHYQSAIYDLNTVIEIDPQDAKAYGDRALNELALGEDALAEKDLKTCIALDPTLEVEYNKYANDIRKNFADERKTAEQRKNFEQIAKAHPEDFDAQLKAGNANYSAERYLEAINFFMAANKLRPTDFDVISLLGRVNAQAHRDVEAEKWFTKALTQKSDDWEVRLGFGAMFLFRKPPDLDRAIKEFHRSLELAPNETAIMATLVRALVIKGDAKEAESMLTRLEKTAPAYDDLAELKGKVAALVKAKTTAGKVPPVNQ